MWAIEVELTPKPVARTTRIMAGLLSPMTYAQVIYLTAPKARPVVMRAAGVAAARGPGPGGGPRPARRRVHPGAAPVSPWAWLKLTIFLWLLRKTVKLTGWLLLAAAVIAAWPVTAGGGGRVRRGVAARLAPGPAVPDRRLGRCRPPRPGWPPWRSARPAGARRCWLPAGRGRTAGATWPRRGLARAFLLLAPVALAGGLALGGLLWAWRIYAITTGLGGITASAPIIFDARQWNRQARTALGLTKAPGAVPLLARGGLIPVGGTIRAIGHRWHPVLALPAAACARHMVIVGATGSGKTNLMIRLWAGWFTATLASGPGRDGATGRCWSCWTARAAATPASKPNAPAACSTAPAPAGSPSGRTRPGCACGTCRPMSWRCCCTR